MLISRRHCARVFEDLMSEPQARPIMGAMMACLLCLLFIIYCISASSSLVLTGCAWLTLFSIFCLAAGLISILVKKRPSCEQFSYGLARGPVLAVFASTVLAQLSALFLVKESVERLLEAEGTKTYRLLPGAVAAVVAQLISVYAVRNEPVHHVLTAASSSWLQEHAADLAHAICQVVPGLSRILLPRLNPLSLLAFLGGLSCFITHILLEHKGLWWADAVGAVCLSLAVLGTMWPLSAYTGRILLQTAPPHLLGQLDRCLREASTLDGVLELTGAHFWQLDFAKLTGTVTVRVRRDADEQLVLAYVTDKLCSIVSNLTVQVVKDADWQTLSGGQDSHLSSYSDYGHGHGHGHSHDSGQHGGHSHSHDSCSDHSHDSGHGHGHGHGHSHGGHQELQEVVHHH